MDRALEVALVKYTSRIQRKRANDHRAAHRSRHQAAWHAPRTQLKPLRRHNAAGCATRYYDCSYDYDISDTMSVCLMSTTNYFASELPFHY